MMYVPLNCAIVTHVYQSCKTESTIVPQTMTQLYTALVKTLLLRYLKETLEYKRLKIRSFSDLPSHILEKFHQVCKLAYDGINKGEIIFSELSEDFDSLGLMQSTHELYIDEGALVSYNFLHLTIQEYLAAYHLLLLDEEEQRKFLSSSRCERMNSCSPYIFPSTGIVLEQQNSFAVSKFLAGLTTCKLRSCTSPVQSIIQRYKWISSPISVGDLHLLFELHNVTGIFESTDSIVFKPRVLSPFDYYVLGYCIGAIDCNWEVHLADFVESADKIEMLMKGLTAAVPSEPRQGITDLHLNISMSKSLLELLHMGGDMHNLANLLQQFPDLKALRVFSDTDIEGIQSKARETVALKENQWPGCDRLIKSLHLFPNLAHLGLAKYHRDIDTVDHEDIVAFIKNLPECVNSLGIYDTTIGEKVCKAVGDLLASSSHCIDCLDMSYNCLQPKAVQCIIDGLSKNESLEELDISGSELSLSNVTSLAAVLEVNTTLAMLDVKQCVVGHSAVATLAKSLENNSGLETLNLSEITSVSCPVSCADDKLCGIIALSSMLQRNENLFELTLANCGLGAEHAVLLARGIEGNSTLEILDIQENSICDKGAAALAKALENVASSRIELDLQVNQIGDEGASAIGNALINNSALETLNLQQNCIGDIGAAAIGKALENCESALKLLNFWQNQVGDEGAAAIGKGLINNSKLEILNLQENSIGDIGTVGIAEGLKTNCTLKELLLQNNSVGDQGAFALARAIKSNASLALQSLQLHGNCMTKEGRITLCETTCEQNRAKNFNGISSYSQ